AYRDHGHDDGRAHRHGRADRSSVLRSDACRWQGTRQPMFVHVHIDGVGDVAAVVGPKIDLAEANPIEPLLRQTVEAITELLGIGELAATPFDDALLAADVERR